MPRLGWNVVAALAGVHLVLAALVARRAAESPLTYVFTPLVDVVPGGVPLSAGEAATLAAEAKNQVDARDIQKAYARMGSVLSLDDLLRGVEAIDAGSTALSDGQRTAVRGILDAAREKHQAVVAVQTEILDLERSLDGQAASVLAQLPGETRARVEARARASGGKGGGSANANPGAPPPAQGGPPPAGTPAPAGAPR